MDRNYIVINVIEYGKGIYLSSKVHCILLRLSAPACCEACAFTAQFY